MLWNNLYDDDLIPSGTLAKVKMSIKCGSYNEPALGWTGDCATRNANTGSVYLNTEFVILEGEYANRKILGMIGLHSNNGDAWADMGRSFIQSVLNSAYGVTNDDQSKAAQNARRINGLSDLDGLEFVAKIDIEQDKNVIKQGITCDHKDYAGLIGQPAATPTKTALPSIFF